MSNLQDVPLTEPENIIPTTNDSTTDNDTSGPKSNSLKRFFKLGKKANPTQNFAEDGNELDDEVNKDTAKPGTINRLLTRLKSTSKTESIEPSTSTNPDMEETSGKPAPNAKPTLKSSISTYWRHLFHRQKAINREGSHDHQDFPETKQEAIELNQVQQTEPAIAEIGLPETPVTSRETIKMIGTEKSLEEEVQMLAISDDIVDKKEA
ncbi:uncharacterized protein LOC6569973 [Drosophila grimshawi]|uniref:GH22394 n=1 Tax=Drosophila grimshawi TaxID=7222 RepID=B4JZ10_DROGR|nr:uncharacterized protein LOC6569973 [Drosophila grimshawi]EDV98625.1 GH22394 [Drosophila grimshawi]